MNVAGLFHRQQGSGPDLALLHGWGMHGGLFHELGEHLQARYQVHTIDLPGHGRSGPTPGGFTLASLADTMLNALPTPVTVVAWSLGGIVALRMALQAPKQVTRLVLICSTPQFFQSGDWPQGMAAGVLDSFATQLDQDYQETVRHFLALSALGSPGMRDQLRQLRETLFKPGAPDPAALRSGLNILAGESVLAQLDRIKAPVDFIMGGRDRIVHPDCGREAAARLADGRCEVISEASHLPFISHQKEFLQCLDRSLSESP